MKIPIIICMLFGFVMMTACGGENKGDGGNGRKTKKFVLAGSALSEIVYAIGQGEKIVGVDVTSDYPPALRELPKVGPYLNLNLDAIMGLEPTDVLITADAGPESVLSTLREKELLTKTFVQPKTVEGTKALLMDVGTYFESAKAVDDFVVSLEEDLDALYKWLEEQQIKLNPRILFLYARGKTVLMGGAETEADGMIKLASGANVVESPGYVEYDADLVAQANPEIVLMTKGSVAAMGGIDSILNLQGLEGSVAAQGRKLVSMEDSYLLGFGLRVGKAGLDLAKAFHQKADVDDGTGNVYPDNAEDGTEVGEDKKPGDVREGDDRAPGLKPNGGRLKGK